MSRSSKECFSAAHPQGSFKPRGVLWGLLFKKTSSTRLQNVSLEPTPSVTWPRSPSRGQLENFTCGQTIWIRFQKGSPTCKGRGSSAGLVSSLCVSQHSGALNFSLWRDISHFTLRLSSKQISPVRETKFKSPCSPLLQMETVLC